MSIRGYRWLKKDSEYRAKLFSIESSIIEILHYIPRGLQDYTSHGYAHSKRVIKYLDDIIRIYDQYGAKLSDLEVFILYATAWLHDIGCLVERRNHAEKSAEMTKILQQNGYIDGISDELPFLQWVISGHSKKQNIHEVPKVQYLRGEKIRLRFLAALFRLADACDIDRRRAPKIVYKFIKDELNEQSKKFWEGHQGIDSVLFDPDEGSIIIGLQDEEKSDIIIEDFKKDFETIREILKTNKFPCREIKIFVQKYPNKD